MKEKRISVVMCTYNGAKYLREQLDSIVNQTYPIYELIIQDDCSTDQTVNIIKEEYIPKYPFVHLYRNTIRKGINENFFSAFEHATGEYISISDQDDIWELNKIEELASHIQDNWLIYADDLLFREESGEKKYFTFQKKSFLAWVIPGHSCLFSQKLLSLIEPLPKKLYLYDTCLGLYAMQQNKIAFLDEVLTYHRRHSDATTNQGKGYSKIQGYYYALKAYLKGPQKKKMKLFYSEIVRLEASRPHDPTYRYAALLSKPHLFNMFRACLLAYKELLKENPHPAFMKRVHSFFYPFFNCRDLKLICDYENIKAQK